jgi:hypothetical protein
MRNSEVVLYSSFPRCPRRCRPRLGRRATSVDRKEAADRKVAPGPRGRQERRERLDRRAPRDLGGSPDRSDTSHRRRCKNSWICGISWMVLLRNFNCSFNASRRFKCSSTPSSRPQDIRRTLTPRKRKPATHLSATPREEASDSALNSRRNGERPDALRHEDPKAWGDHHARIGFPRESVDA